MAKLVFDYIDTGATRIPQTTKNLEGMTDALGNMERAAKSAGKAVSDSFKMQASAFARAAQGVESRSGNAARVGAARWAPGDGGRWRPPGPPKTPSGPGFNPDFEGAADAAAALVKPGLAHYLDRLANLGRNVAVGLTAAAGTIYAVGRAAHFTGGQLVQGAKDFGDYETALARVGQSLKDYNLFSEAALESHKKFAKELSRTTTFSQPDILKTMGTMAAGGLSGRQLERSVLAVKNLASEFPTMDPAAIARNLVAAKLGATDYLRRFNVNVPRTGDPTQRFEAALDFIERNFAGQATARFNTDTGQIEEFIERLVDLRREMGGPLVSAAASAVKVLGPVVENLTDMAAEGDGAFTQRLNEAAEKLAKVVEYMTDLALRLKNIALPNYRGGTPPPGIISRSLSMFMGGRDPMIQHQMEQFALGISGGSGGTGTGQTAQDKAVALQLARNQLVADFNSHLRDQLRDQKAILIFAQSELDISRRTSDIERERATQRRAMGLTGEAGVAGVQGGNDISAAAQEARIARLKYDEVALQLQLSATGPEDNGGSGENTPRNEQTAKWAEAMERGGDAARIALDEMKNSTMADIKLVENLAEAWARLEVAEMNVAQTRELAALQMSAAERADRERLQAAQDSARILDTQTEATAEAARLELEYNKGLVSRVDLLNSAAEAEQASTAALLEQNRHMAEMDQSAANLVQREAEKNALIAKSVREQERLNEEIRREEAGIARITAAREHQGRLYTINNNLAAGLRQNRVGVGGMSAEYAGLLDRRDSVNESIAASSRAGAAYYNLRSVGAPADQMQAAFYAKEEAQKQANSALQEFTDNLKLATGTLGLIKTAGELGSAASGINSNLKTAFGGISPGIDSGLDKTGQILDRFNALIGIIQGVQTILGIIQAFTAAKQISDSVLLSGMLAANTATAASTASALPFLASIALGTWTDAAIPLAGGGPVPNVPGSTPGVDSVPAMLMPNEHVITANDVRAMGGQKRTAAIIRAYADRSVRRMADGGPVSPSPYYAGAGSLTGGGSVGGGRPQILEVRMDGYKLFRTYVNSVDGGKQIVKVVNNSPSSRRGN